MKRLVTSLAVCALLFACADSPKPEVNSEDQLTDALISFTTNAQATRYMDALAFVTWDEQQTLKGDNGDVKPEYKTAMTRMRLSALQKAPLSLDIKGRIVGMVAVLDDANRKFSTSDEQRKASPQTIDKPAPSSTLESSSSGAAVRTPAAAPSLPPAPSSMVESSSSSAASDSNDKPLSLDDYLK